MLATAKVASTEGVACGPWDQIMLLGLTLYKAFHTFASGLTTLLRAQGSQVQLPIVWG